MWDIKSVGKVSHSVNEIIEYFHMMLCVGVCGETSGVGV